MSEQAFERFRELVLQDTALQQRLQQAGELKDFVPLVIALAAERGLEISAVDVEEAMRASRRAWLERWI